MDTTQISKLHKLKHEDQVSVRGNFYITKTLKTREGDCMAFVEVRDSTGTVEVVVFADMYKPNKDLLESCDGEVYFMGRLDILEGERPPLIIVENISRADRIK